MRVKRLYRVTATYADYPTTRRHYQSNDAAQHRAALLRQGGVSYSGYAPEGRWVPALSVTVEKSDPITWSAS